jgi:serine phosphatase RsbU (regulator of sigma subunit)
MTTNEILDLHISSTDRQNVDNRPSLNRHYVHKKTTYDIPENVSKFICDYVKSHGQFSVRKIRKNVSHAFKGIRITKNSVHQILNQNNIAYSRFTAFNNQQYVNANRLVYILD